MIYFVIIVVIFIIIKFVVDKNTEVSKINSQGGMRTKYVDLIDFFSEHKHSKVIQISNTCIKISIEDPFVRTTFTIIHGFSNYKILWNHQSSSFGSHELKWKFPEYMDQINAINVIVNEMDNYEKKTLTKYF